MSEQRFYVQRFSGYSIGNPVREPGRYLRVSYYVFDRLDLHNIARAFSFTEKGTRWDEALVRRDAEAECDRLNEWWDAESAVG